MTNKKLRDAFTYWRRISYPAHGALERARGDVAANITRYPSPINRGNWLGAAMSDGAQWGNPEEIGLRFVGWQDEIRREHSYARDLHSGWYTRHDDFDEVFRGCVYQLPARDGCALYIPAYREGSNSRKDVWSDTCGEHSAALDFSNIMRGTRGENTSQYDCADTLLDACRAADSLAENAAEKSREYDEAWQAGSYYSRLREELKETRAELRALLRELKAAREHFPAICKALRETVRDMRQTMRETFKKAETLRENVWCDYHAAFNDGAEETVFS